MIAFNRLATAYNSEVKAEERKMRKYAMTKNFEKLQRENK
jgi:hypothetical protein